jgi:pilus assembly protein CpaE
VDAETILAVVRAGAREYVYPPYQPGLLQALERVARDRAQQASVPGAAGQLVGVLSAKGGCGATTIACHLASEVRRLTQKEILLADLDLHGGGVGFAMAAQSQYSIQDAASNLERLDLSFWKGLVSNGRPRLEVIHAPRQPLLSAAPQPEPFREVLRFTRANYDWVIGDLGRTLNYFTSSLIEEFDTVLLVTTPEVPAFYLTKNIVQDLRRQGFSDTRIRLLINRAARGEEFAISQVERLIGLPVYHKLPNSYPDLYRAYAEGRLLTPDTALGKQFTRLATDLLGLPQSRKPPSSLPLLGVRKMVAGWGGSA